MQMFWPAHHKYHLGSFFLSALALNERNRRFSEVLRVTAEKTAAKQREDSVTITHVVFNPEQATEFVSYCCSVTQLCLTLCNTMDYSMPVFPVLHYLLEFVECIHSCLYMYIHMNIYMYICVSLGEISITSDTQMTPPLWQKAKKN